MQDSKSTNSDMEWGYFSRFMKLYDMPKGEIIRGDRPDIVIELDGKKDMLGIEIARLFEGNGIAEVLNQKRRLLRVLGFFIYAASIQIRTSRCLLYSMTAFSLLIKKEANSLPWSLQGWSKNVNVRQITKLTYLSFYQISLK